MGSSHGNRVYLQVLLDEHRGQMFLADAKLQNKKPAAWMREIVYQYLERAWGDDAYQDASSKDRDNYQRGVNARLIGRGLKPKPLESEAPQSDQDIDSSN
jgi:hypothetical protein